MPERPRSIARVLVIDDQAEMARLLADQLADAGYEVETATSGADGIAAVRERPFDVVLTDLRMEKVDGFDVLDVVRSETACVPVIMMTAFGAIDSAIKAIRRGAYHYITKPFRLDEVILSVERAIAERRLHDENAALRASASREGFGDLVGRSRVMVELYSLIERVAQSNASVLVRGESGVGKELVARALHDRGPRRDRPFVPVNCTTIPESLLESELFGHVRGAYSGAATARRGLFLEADGGTLFLDEIGDMAPGLQSKLLRVIEDGSIRAIGSDVPRQTNTRIIAATNQDLEARVREGRFRGDLFYRLNVIPILVPPLSERIEDIPALVSHFFARAKGRNPSSPARSLSTGLVSALARRSYPGNVRQLENLVERLVVIASEDEITESRLDAFERDEPPRSAAFASEIEALVPLRQLESDYIAHVVARCGGNKTRAAEILGIDVSTIHRRDRAGST